MGFNSGFKGLSSKFAVYSVCRVRHHPFPKTPGKRFLSLAKRPNRLWGAPSLLINGYWSLLLWVKRQRRETCHSPPPSAEVKNEWSSNTSPAVLICLAHTWLNLLHPYCYFVAYLHYCHSLKAPAANLKFKQAHFPFSSVRLLFTSHRGVRKNSAGHCYRFFGKELDILIEGKKS